MSIWEAVSSGMVPVWGAARDMNECMSGVWRASTTTANNADRSQKDFHSHIYTHIHPSSCFTELRGEKETAKPSISFSLIDVLRFTICFGGFGDTDFW